MAFEILEGVLYACNGSAPPYWESCAIHLIKRLVLRNQLATCLRCCQACVQTICTKHQSFFSAFSQLFVKSQSNWISWIALECLSGAGPGKRVLSIFK